MQVRCDECPELVTLEVGQMTPVLCPACAAHSEREFFRFAHEAGYDTRDWPRFHTTT